MNDIERGLSEFHSRRSELHNIQDLRKDLSALARLLFPAHPQLPLLEDILSSESPERGIERGEVESLSYADSLFVESIANLDPFRIGPPDSALCARLREALSNPGTDELTEAPLKWSLPRVLNFAMLLCFKATLPIAAVTSIRNEGIGILEWIAHHRALGFDNIYVYANDNTDASDALLAILAKHGVIRFIKNVVSANTSPQIKAYEHSLHLLPELRQHRWVMYLDADEFFIPRCEPGYNVESLLQRLDETAPESLLPTSIAFNWKWFGSENVFERTDGLILNRFLHSIDNEHVKCMTQLDSIVSMRLIHAPNMFRGCVAVNSNMEPIPAGAVCTAPEYGCGQINHYWNKSFKEFVIKKLRGRGAVGAEAPQRDFSTFFDWGENSRRGNFDPPNEAIVTRDSAYIQQLRGLPGVVDAEREIEVRFEETIQRFDHDMDLKNIYNKRGRTTC